MIESWITQLRKGVVEYGVLLVLHRGETYGYEIVQSLKSSRELAAGESTVYPILARLKEDGYLSCRVVKGEGGPPRRYYQMTAKGRVRLAEMEAYWPTLEHGLAKLRAAAFPKDGKKSARPFDPPTPPPQTPPPPRIPPLGDDRDFWA